jgi:hypothetical protein
VAVVRLGTEGQAAPVLDILAELPAAREAVQLLDNSDCLQPLGNFLTNGMHTDTIRTSAWLRSTPNASMLHVHPSRYPYRHFPGFSPVFPWFSWVSFETILC